MIDKEKFLLEHGWLKEGKNPWCWYLPPLRAKYRLQDAFDVAYSDSRKSVRKKGTHGTRRTNVNTE